MDVVPVVPVVVVDAVAPVASKTVSLSGMHHTSSTIFTMNVTVF